MTKIYGCSDDLIESEGDVSGEMDYIGTDDKEQGALLMCSDGTLLEVKYGKAGMGVWEVKLINQGSLFEKIDICTDEDAEIYSDIAYFTDGLKWIYAAKEWERLH